MIRDQVGAVGSYSNIYDRNLVMRYKNEISVFEEKKYGLPKHIVFTEKLTALVDYLINSSVFLKSRINIL